MIIWGSRARARAMDTSWRSPLDIDSPASERTVSGPWGSLFTNCRQRAAVRTSSKASGVSRGLPSVMFSRMLLEKRNGSWVTMAIFDLRAVVSRFPMSVRFTRMVPEEGS